MVGESVMVKTLLEPTLLRTVHPFTHGGRTSLSDSCATWVTSEEGRGESRRKNQN